MAYALEERVKEVVKVVKLPSMYTRQNRGADECCCKFDVFGSETNDPEKKMYTSAWIKDAQEVSFVLVTPNNGEVVLTALPFVNDEDALYTTVDWSNIIDLYGIGCYQIRIDFLISGIEDSFIWGNYNLFNYDLQRLNHKVMITSVFDSFQTFENINFKDTKVKDSLCFNGWFGNSQDGMLVENLVYNNRETRKSFRESVIEYELTCQTESECIVNKLRDQHLLHENEMYVNDYNAFNHNQYLNTAVIVAESPKATYNHPKATITVKLEDKFKNKRSKFTK
jgi:hypothetical protein